MLGFLGMVFSPIGAKRMVMIYEGPNGVYNSPSIRVRLDREAKEKRDEMRDMMRGVKGNPILKKEQHKPHPNDPELGE